MANELKPCPFCGPGESVVECYADDYGYWKVGCGRCGSHSGTRPQSDPDAQAKVISHWNTRPAAPVEGLTWERFGNYEQARSILGLYKVKPHCGGFTWSGFTGTDFSQPYFDTTQEAKEGAEKHYLTHIQPVLERARSQAEDIIADRDERLKDWQDKWAQTDILRLKAEADNAALTARVKELSKHVEELQEKNNAETCACSYDAVGDVCKGHSPTVKALETQLAAAKKALADIASHDMICLKDPYRTILQAIINTARAALEAKP